MAEKRGETEKLKFDFNQAHALEIKHKVLGWYRVTSRDFRSFDGPRRTIAPTQVVQGRVNFPMITTKYFGPVYYWGTNTELEYKGSNTIIQSTKMMKLREISQSRLK
jgi:hypothetical protein